MNELAIVKFFISFSDRSYVWLNEPLSLSREHIVDVIDELDMKTLCTQRISSTSECGTGQPASWFLSVHITPVNSNSL